METAKFESREKNDICGIKEIFTTMFTVSKCDLSKYAHLA